MEKIVRDGMVAVAVSPGFGAGWSTWNDVHPMDARFNQLFLDDKYLEADKLCTELELGYTGGAYSVVIQWIPVGTKFIINEYDGSESIQYLGDTEWLEA